MGPSILFIHPKLEGSRFDDIRLPPLGLAYCAASLRRAGFGRVRIADANISRDPDGEIRKALAVDPPDIVGLSLTTPTFRSALEAARTVKGLRPRAKIIFGGVHPTLFPEEVASRPEVDAAVFGEGEATIVELAAALAKGRSLKDVKGVAFRTSRGVTVNAPRPLAANLDDLPLPAFDLLSWGRYSSPLAAHSPLGMLITSRGCPFRCIFCDNHVVLGKKYRAYSPGRMLEEVRVLVRDYGVREIMFKESDITLDPERLKEFCRLLGQEPKKVHWTCCGHAGTLDLGLLRDMRRAGCRIVQYGVESGDPDILKTLNKGTTVPQIEETFRLTRWAGIKTVANIMIGNPGDTRETIARTIALTKRLKADFANIQFCTPYPGTELYRLAQANKWFLDDGDPLRLQTDTCSMNATNIPTPELKGLLKKAYRSFYLRPGYAWRRSGTLKLEDWGVNLRGLRKILGWR